MDQQRTCGGHCASCASQSACGSCNTGNGACGGCGMGGGTLYLTEEEIGVLRRFGEIPFWPLARRADAEEPVCLEEGIYTAAESSVTLEHNSVAENDMKAVLSALAQKGLIRLDFDLPLDNFDYSAYAAYPHHGSMALTALGQRAVELLEIQGAER